MSKKFQLKQSITINAPLETVWEFNQDLSKIPEFHPRVNKVDLVTGDQYRKEGATYRCYIKNGKHNCTERDTEIIPKSKIVTSLPEDTLGLSKILKDYIVETHFKKIDEKTTLMEFYHFYFTPGLFRSLLNLYVKSKINSESLETLRAIKETIEKSFVKDRQYNPEG